MSGEAFSAAEVAAGVKQKQVMFLGGAELEERRCRPKPLMGIMGKVELHSRIVSRLKERGNVNVTSFQESHQWVPRKAKRVNYDNYKPGGLIKSGWIPKYAKQVPAVCVYFLNWTDATNMEPTVSSVVSKLKYFDFGKFSCVITSLHSAHLILQEGNPLSRH